LQALENLDINQKKPGSNKTKMIFAQVFVASINDKLLLDKVWQQWIGCNLDHWPQRACWVGGGTGGNWLIEITVTAVRNTQSSSMKHYCSLTW